MGRYLLLWELNQSLIPVDPKERGGGYKLLMSLVRQDMETGVTKDWGCFVGEKFGYCVVEGTEVDVMNMVQKYSPYVIFQTHPVASEEQVNEMINAMPG
jgi:hypothetical protein